MTIAEFKKEVEDQCVEISKKSLSSLATHLQTTEDELTSFFSMERLRFLWQTLNHVPYDEESKKDLLRQLVQSGDFWALHRDEMSRYGASFFKRVLNLLESYMLPVDYGYYLEGIHRPIIKILIKKGIPHDDLFLSRTFSEIDLLPKIALFEIDTDAFLAQTSEIADMPAIYYHLHLFNVVDSFCDNAAWLLLKLGPESGDLEVRDMADITERLLHPGALAVKHFNDCLEAVLHNNLVPTMVPYTYQDRDFNLHIEYINAIAISFIQFHEYGHLLLGHLVTGPSKKAEFDADMFAHAAYKLEHPDSLQRHFVAALTFMMFLFRFREAKLKISSPNYPTAAERLAERMSRLNEKEKLFSVALWKNLTEFVLVFFHKYHLTEEDFIYG